MNATIANHVPGPWSFRWSDFADKFEVYEIEGDGDAGAGVENAPIAEVQDYSEDQGVNEANARLIAAAPDLLEALASYLVLGTGKCIIGKAQVEKAYAAVISATSQPVA